MKFPPEPKTEYVFDNDQDRIIFEKLGKISEKKLTLEEKESLKFLYSQLEKDWRTPLEEYVDKWLNS